MTPPVPISEIRRAVKLWHKALSNGIPATTGRGFGLSALRHVHNQLGLGGTNAVAVTRRLNTAVALGIAVQQWDGLMDPAREEEIRQRYGVRPEGKLAAQPDREREAGGVPPTAQPVTGREQIAELAAKVAPILRKGPLTGAELAAKLGVDQYAAAAALAHAVFTGAAIATRGDKWHLDDAPPMGIQRDGKLVELFTDADGCLAFAATGDQHLCSKYERLDCLNEYYDQIAKREITTVLNTGNWIDGEATFNRHDLKVHGMDEQMQYLAREYPKRAGVHTYAITGADHEGWYARREGVDVGKYAANVMREAGRDDWTDLGYMEAYVDLVHRESGKRSKLSVMHPGGGSSYAVSYAPQKIVEGFDGGDKPAVLLIGHYHKSGYNNIRNCHTMQTGCFQDQTVFMRQKKLSAHLGGCFVKIHVDPYTGAVDECTYTFRNYFVKDYYNGRWSQHGPAKLAGRAPK